MLARALVLPGKYGNHMEIKISRSAHACKACGRAFIHDEEMRSLARAVEKELVREDYCAACWTPALAGQAFSVWLARYYDPHVAEQEPPEVFSPLRQLFYESHDSQERTGLAMAFLAAQLLQRQKVFRRIKESDESDGEVRISLYSDRIGNRLIEVRDPSFSYAELETGRTALLERLREIEAPQETGESPDDAQCDAEPISG